MTYPLDAGDAGNGTRCRQNEDGSDLSALLRRSIPRSFAVTYIASELATISPSWDVPSLAPYWVSAGLESRAVLELASLPSASSVSRVRDLLRQSGDELGLPTSDDAAGRERLALLAVRLMAAGHHVVPLAQAISVYTHAAHTDPGSVRFDEIGSLATLLDEDPESQIPSALELAAVDLCAARMLPPIGWREPIADEPSLE